jgi:hypothetical protein
MPEFPIPDAGAANLLNWMLLSDTSTVETLLLRLYTNDVTPGHTSVTADFTEATFGGYSQKLLTRSGWSPATLAIHVAQLTRSAGSFTWNPTTSGQVLYGAFVIGGTSLQLYAARRFANPRTVAAGTPFSLLPVFTLQSIQV